MSIARSLKSAQQYLDEIAALNTATELIGAIEAAKSALHFALIEAEAKVEYEALYSAEYVDFLADQERDRQDALADAMTAHWSFD